MPVTILSPNRAGSDDQVRVLNIQRDGMPLSPKGATARNPAFDITPHRLITGIVTEHGVVSPSFKANLAKVVKGN